MPTIAYYTLGCKINQYETEKIRENLENCGFSTVSFSSEADVYIINSCTVTNTADAKSRRAIRQAIRKNPNALVVATGCYAELSPGEISEIEGVDLIIGNEDKESIPERMAARFPQMTSLKESRPRTRTRAVVKVQDGCSQFCAYCAVPYARSVQKSRKRPDVIAEIEALAGFGYKEVVISGIRLGSYTEGLAELIRQTAAVEGIERIRLSSIEAWEITDGLLATIAETSKVCRHLHIPLQSGDDGVLKLMRRPYTLAEYAAVVEKARIAIPELGLTTDVIVGFPGETDEAFEQSYRFVEEMNFSKLHVFRYSPRSGTDAASFPNQVEEIKKVERSEKMIDLGNRMAQDFAEKLIGRSIPVLVESKRTELLSGFTDNYVEVQFAGNENLRGKIVEVCIENTTDSGLFGAII